MGKDNVKDNTECMTYYDYTIYKDGRIFNQKGKELVLKNYNGTGIYCNFNVKHPDGSYTIKRKKASRVIFELFSGHELTKGEYVVAKDGDDNNLSFDNLMVIKRSEFFANYCPTTRRQRQFSKEQCEEIAAQYDKNFKPRSQYDKKGLSLRDLASKYKCSLNTIQRIVNGTYYKG